MLGNLVSRVLFRLLRAMERLNRRYSLHGDHPFFDPSDFAWTREVALHTEAIQKELSALLPQVERLPNFQDISPDQAMLTTDAGWKTFFSGATASNARATDESAPTRRRRSHSYPA